jgi:hypothetical protein
LNFTPNVSWAERTLTMTYYDSFDCKINCEEFYAEDFEGYGDWSDELQSDLEREQEQAKDWLNGYSPVDEGETYNGIAI